MGGEQFQGFRPRRWAPARHLVGRSCDPYLLARGRRVIEHSKLLATEVSITISRERLRCKGSDQHLSKDGSGRWLSYMARGILGIFLGRCRFFKVSWHSEMSGSPKKPATSPIHEDETISKTRDRSSSSMTLATMPAGS